MGYLNHETKGKLLRATPEGVLERKTSDLVSPENIPFNIVLIQSSDCQWEKPVFGKIPEEYVGKNVRLLQTYLHTDAGVLSIQEMYHDKERFLNTVIVKKEGF